MEHLKNICHTEQNVNLKNLCSYRLGGVGKVVCYPKNIKELGKSMELPENDINTIYTPISYLTSYNRKELQKDLNL